MMRWSSFLSYASSFEEAVQEACRAVTGALHGVSSMKGGPPEVDFAAVFLSSQWESRYRDFQKILKKHLSPSVMIGCSAGGVIAGGKEAERTPAVSLTAALLPGVKLHPFHLEVNQLPDLDTGPQAWEKMVGVASRDNPQFVLIGDPFSFPADIFIQGLDYAFPKSSKVGGLASGGKRPGENILYLNEEKFSTGLAGVAFSGNVALDTIVAQGCRPIGKPMVVTACKDNLLLELDHERPVKVLQALFSTLSLRDQQLVPYSLFLGIVMDPRKKEFTAGDFLIRNLMGADMHKGILAISADLRVGQTVQFHLQDAETSADNLNLLLRQYHESPHDSSPEGALLFSCLGRGESLYGVSNHDSRCFLDLLGKIPLGGFFCSGEIGPVAGATYIHGYTSCFGLFRSARQLQA